MFQRKQSSSLWLWLLLSTTTIPLVDSVLLALYPLPPFVLEFTTSVAPEVALTSTNGDTHLISATDGVNSEWSFELREVTEAFLQQRFVFYLADESASESKETENEFLEFYSHFTTVELATKLYYQPSSTKGSNSGIESYNFKAECFGTIAFEEPHDHKRKPSNEEVQQKFGAYIDSSLTHAPDQLLQQLQSTTQQAWLQSIFQLSGTVVWSPNDSESLDSEKQDTSKLMNTLIALVVLTTSFGLVACLLAYRNSTKVKFDYPPEDIHDLYLQGGSLDAQGSNKPSIIQRADSMDAVRHGQDSERYNDASTTATSILHKSDRYLSKHRPDWMTSTSSSPTATAWNNSNPTRRNYQMPSNPLEFIYSAFSPSSQTEGSNRRLTPRHASTLSDLEAVNLAVSPSEYLDTVEQQNSKSWREHTHPSSKSGGMGQSIWRSVSSFWDDVPQPSQSTLQNHPPPQSQAQHDDDDDDSSNYDFAFQDFPRTDGTPCLIYNDDHELHNFSIGADESTIETDIDLDPEMNDLEATTPVNNDTFANLLRVNSQNGLNHLNDSIDSLDDNDMNSNSSDSDDSDQSKETNDTGSAVDTKQNTAFLNKLERLVQQRHRQYEKKSIVEQHQQARHAERQQERRQQHHAAMESQISVLEQQAIVPRSPVRTGNRSPTTIPQRSPYRHSHNPPFSPPKLASTRVRSNSLQRHDPSSERFSNLASNSFDNHNASGTVHRPSPVKPMPPSGRGGGGGSLRGTRSIDFGYDEYTSTSSSLGRNHNHSQYPAGMTSTGSLGRNSTTTKRPSPHSVLDVEGLFRTTNTTATNSNKRTPPVRTHSASRAHPLPRASGSKPIPSLQQHRRHTSFDLDDGEDWDSMMPASTIGSGGGSFLTGGSATFGSMPHNHHHHHRRSHSNSNSNSGTPHRTSHRRINSHTPPHHNRHHSRNNSINSTDGVGLHGVYAQTRMV